MAALLVVAAIVQLRSAGAWAIVKAPSFDGPGPSLELPDDVVGVIRAEVGPPAATLDAWILEPAAAQGTTLVLHGIRDDKRSMLGVGRALREGGQRVVLVDLRGHGASSGRFLTYGVQESRDLTQLLDQLDALGLLVGPVGIYGPSYGGAVALQTAALDPRVERVVSVSTFSSLRSVIRPYAANVIPWVGDLLPNAFLDLVVDDAGELGGFTPDDADTAAAIAVASRSARVLLVHGLADRDVPFEHARELTRACQPGACELHPVAGADHAGALGSPETLARAVAFLTAPSGSTLASAALAR